MTMHAENQPLTIEEQILLSASIDARDGDLTQAEHARVQALLQQPAARAYVDSLRATRVLVGRHGAAKAPVGFKGRVLAALDEDFDDISRPTALRDGKVIAMPSASWRTPMLALAAAVVVTLGVFFGPALLPSGDTASPADIARDRLSNAANHPDSSTGSDGHWGAGKTPDSGKALDRADEQTGEKAGEETEASRKNALRMAQNNVEKLDKDANDETNEDSPSQEPPVAGRVREDFRRARNGNAVPNPGESREPEGRVESPAKSGTTPEAGDALKKEAAKSKKDLAEDGEKGQEGKESSKTGQAESDANKGASGGYTGGAGGGSSQDRPGLDRKVGSKLEDDGKNTERDNRDNEETKNEARPESHGDDPSDRSQADGTGPVPNKPASPQPGNAQDDRGPVEREKAATRPVPSTEGQESGNDGKRELTTSVVELSPQPGRVLSAQTDILRIAALYGDASVLDQLAADQTVESVVVELDEAKVAELVAALQRLAQRQEYGALQVPEALKAQVAPNTDLAKTAETVRDSLPDEVKVRLAGATPTPPSEPGAAPAPKAASVKVRLQINLK